MKLNTRLRYCDIDNYGDAMRDSEDPHEKFFALGNLSLWEIYHIWK